jgi:hypothetical protein
MTDRSNTGDRSTDAPGAVSAAARRARAIGRTIAAAGEKLARGKAKSPFVDIGR